MAGKKIKLEEEAIGEILVSDIRLGIKNVFQLESHKNK